MAVKESALDLNRAIQTSSQIMSVLFEARQSFEDIFLNWDEPICVVDMDGKIFYFNHEWTFFCNLTSEHIRDKFLFDILEPGQSEVLNHYLENVIWGDKSHAEFELNHNISDELSAFKWTLQKHHLSEDFSVIVVRAKNVSKLNAYKSEARLASSLERLCRMKRNFIFAKSIQDIGVTFFENVTEHLDIKKMTSASLRIVDLEDQQEALEFMNDGSLGFATRIDNHPADEVRKASEGDIHFIPGCLTLPIREFGVAKIDGLPPNYIYDINSLDFLIEACRECSTSIRSFLHLQYELERNQIENENVFVDHKKADVLTPKFYKIDLKWDLAEGARHPIIAGEINRAELNGFLYIANQGEDLESKMIARYMRGRAVGLFTYFRDTGPKDSAEEMLEFMMTELGLACSEIGKEEDCMFAFIIIYNPKNKNLYMTSTKSLKLQNNKNEELAHLPPFATPKDICSINVSVEEPIKLSFVEDKSNLNQSIPTVTFKGKL